jgi:hypothetical protein
VDGRNFALGCARSILGCTEGATRGGCANPLLSHLKVEAIATLRQLSNSRVSVVQHSLHDELVRLGLGMLE